MDIKTQKSSDLHLSGAIGDYFVIEGHLLSTRSADAYKALNKSHQERGTVWVMRDRFAQGSEDVRKFLDRMQAIQALDPPVAALQGFGVDAEGTAFGALGTLSGHPVATGNIELTEAERRLISCLRLVARLHAEGIVCGDLCGSSFWVDRAGSVSFIGLLGAFDNELSTTKALPQDVLPYLAPEIWKNAGAVSDRNVFAGDVFSLGVLGYYLLTGAYPFGEGEALLQSDFNVQGIKPVSSFLHIPPVWSEQVLLRCLELDPDRRFANAGEVLQAISEIRQRSLNSANVPALRDGESKTLKTGASKSGQQPDGLLTAPAIRPAPPPMKAPPPHEPNNRLKIIVFVVFLGVIAGLAVERFFLREAATRVTEDQGSMVPDLPDVADPDLREADQRIRSDVSETEKKASIDKFRDSEDPVAHHQLIQIAKNIESVEIRRYAESAIVHRARKLGAMRSAEQVKQWLRGQADPNLPGYEAVLMSLDMTLPLEEKNSLLRQAYPSNAQFILRLAAALALDTDRLEDFQPVLAQLVGDAIELLDAEEYSALGLILVHYQLATVFADDIVQRREQLTDKDILRVLKILAERNDVNTRAIANLALQRGALSKLRSIFLKIVRDRASLPPDVLTSLIRAAGGVLRVEDLASFGRWIDVEAERVLLAVLADTRDRNLLKEAFDVLGGKSVVIEPSASLLEWVRTHHWSDRVDFAHIVGVVAFLDLLPVEEVETAFKAFDKYVQSTDLIGILMDINNPLIVRLVIQKYPDQLDLGAKLNLLQHSDKRVRLAAVRTIETNNVLALKLISEAYAKEQDEEVKKEYMRFDMIRERARK